MLVRINAHDSKPVFGESNLSGLAAILLIFLSIAQSPPPLPKKKRRVGVKTELGKGKKALPFSLICC